MSKLSDTQLILLSRAAAHEDGMTTCPSGMNKAGAAKTAASLVARKLMREVRGKPGMPVWREGEDGRPINLVITAAGRKAVGAEENASPPETPNASPRDPKSKTSERVIGAPLETAVGAASAASTPNAGKAPRSGSKQALVIEMLSTKAGTTIDALVDATGWLPHTTRAALTGLRKRGMSITRERQEGKVSIYRIAGGAQTAAAAA